jgi:hypothetical protein
MVGWLVTTGVGTLMSTTAIWGEIRLDSALDGGVRGPTCRLTLRAFPRLAQVEQRRLAVKAAL